MDKFGTWLDENYDGLSNFSLNEASSKIVNTDKGWQAQPEKLKMLSAIFGVDGKILTAAEAQAQVNADREFSGVFWAKKGEQIKLTVSKVNLLPVVQVLNDAGISAKTGSEGIEITFEDGTIGSIRQTGNKIEKNSGKNGEVISSNILPASNTDIQEAITAAILQHKAKKGKLTGELPEHIVNFLGEKKAKACGAFEKWILSSDPVKLTGICYYIDFPGADSNVEGFQLELCNFLTAGKSGTWITAFKKLYESNVIGEITSVFKNGVSNWGAARFIHFLTRRSSGKSTPCFGEGSWVGKYLKANRTDQNIKKDTIDKSDIFLCFNTQVAEKIINELVPGAAYSREEYCSLMNQYINDKDFIGISLKKISSAVSVSAVNFKTFTTAIGDNIADDKKVAFNYEGPGSKNNTLNIQKAKIKNTELVDNKGNPKVSFVIEVPLNAGHGHDIHVGNDETILINVRSNQSNDLSCVIEGSFKSAAAQLGKMNSAIKLYKPDFNVTELLKKNCGAGPNDKKSDLEPLVVSDGYLKTAIQVLRLFRADEELFNKVIALGSGYPLKIGTKDNYECIIDSSPYIKIY